MVFSSSVFLFAFLPLVLLLYYNPLNRLPVRMFLVSALFALYCLLMYFSPAGLPVLPLFLIALAGAILFFQKNLAGTDTSGTERAIRNLVLLIASLVFYAYGEPKYIVLLLLSIVVNWGFGLWVGRHARSTAGKWLVAVDLFYNIAVFFIFKYMNFVSANLNAAFSLNLPHADIVLPIGISFYTFQALSYVIDVYRGEVPAEKNPLKVGLYIAMFPQLVAGPIVRYNTVSLELTQRRENWRDFSSGAVRFTLGLGKKMILANPCAYVADQAFNAGGNLTAAAAWAGAIAYTFQIYFDFSGYSDMAIGLGRMFGFHFQENFNFPYIAGSITDFWRRWHISLSTWFRDYVYIPLGGSRVSSTARMVFNLFVVWLLTGIWHGANWTFLCWGLFYFVLLLLERMTGVNRKSSPLGYLYTMPCVIIAWILFRSNSIAAAGEYLGTMFHLTGKPVFKREDLFLLSEYAPFLIAAAVCSFPILPALVRRRFGLERIQNPKIRKAGRKILTFALFAFVLWVFLLAVSFVVKSTNNPFIYFNF